jgi:hypothetical protein
VGGGGVKILIDTREKLGFTFEHKRYAGTVVEVGTLDTGDYSLAGLTDRVAVERKTLPDLVACLGEAFRERAEACRCPGGLRDSSRGELGGVGREGNYRSQLTPHSARQSVLAFTARYRLPFLFAGSQPAAEYVTWWFLKQYLGAAYKRWGSHIKAYEERKTAGPSGDLFASRVLKTPRLH